MDNRFQKPEQVQDLVSLQERFDQIQDAVRSTSFITAGSMIEYFSPLIEQAYIAGANRVNITQGLKPIKDTGEILVDARVFVKDKGMIV